MKNKTLKEKRINLPDVISINNKTKELHFRCSAKVYNEEDVKEKIQEFLRDLKHEFNTNPEVLMNWKLIIDRQAKEKFGDLE